MAGKVINSDLAVEGNLGVTGEMAGNAGLILGAGIIAGGAILTQGAVTASGDINSSGYGNFEKDLTVSGNSHIMGTLSVDVDVILYGQDCAEDFSTAVGADTTPGTVMIVDDDGLLQHSVAMYDTRVAGVISGAAPYRPGLLLGRGLATAGGSPLALVGRVATKVDATFGPIRCGDLLTTSQTSGHAMVASDRTRAVGAIIGKALEPLATGRGMIAMLVSLH
jgi:hypothetical protein